jgi:hypothetical protein
VLSQRHHSLSYQVQRGNDGQSEEWSELWVRATLLGCEHQVRPGRHEVLLVLQIKVQIKGGSQIEELGRVRIEESSNLGLCDRTSLVPVLVLVPWTVLFPIGCMVRLAGHLLVRPLVVQQCRAMSQTEGEV